MQSHEPFDYDDRYGVRKKRSWVGVALITAVLGIGWIAWSGLYHSNPDVRVQLISFTIDSDREVSVRYSIERNDSEAILVCTLLARDYYKDIVGQVDLEIPAGKEKVELVSQIPTRSPAVNADVSTCRVK
jgi:hypothetical protein